MTEQAVFDALYGFAQEWWKYRNPAYRNDSSLVPAGVNLTKEYLTFFYEDPHAYEEMLGLDDDQAAFLDWFASNVPIFGDFVKMRDNFNYIMDYMKNYGLDWSDMRYPSKVTGSGSSPFGSLNFVSSNLKKLYR